MSFIATPSGGISGLGSTPNAALRTNGTSGTSAQGSLVTIDDAGNITAPGITNTPIGGSTGKMNWLTVGSAADLAGPLVFRVEFAQAGGSVGQPVVSFTDNSTVSMHLAVSSGEAQWRTNVGTMSFAVGNATAGSLLLNASGAHLATGTNDQMLSLGAASGTGGGVLNLNGINSAPTAVAGQGTMCVLIMGGGGGPGFYFDRPLNGDGSYLTSVPGTWTIGTGWTANADAGDKTAVIPSSATIATIQTAANLLAAGLGDLIAATAQKVKAMEATDVNLVAPNH